MSRITHLDTEPVDSDLPLTALVHSWSIDGAELLYSLVQFGTFSKRVPDSPSPRCGYYSVDPETRRSVRKSIPFPLLLWLPADSSIVSGPGQSFVTAAGNDILYMGKAGSDSMRAIGYPGHYAQLSASPDGRRVVATYSPKGRTTRVVSIDLASGSQTTVAGPSHWGRFSRPTYSPSGRRIAYVETDSLFNGLPVQGLVVDGSRVFSCDGGVTSYRWIDDTTVVMTCRSTLIIVDPDSRDIRAQVRLDTLPCD